MKAKKLSAKDVFMMVTSCYLFLMMTFFLLFVGTKGYQGIVDAKYSAFLFLSGGYVLLMMLLFLEMLFIGEIKVKSPAELIKDSSLSQKLISAYLLFTWISALLSGYYPNTIIGMSRNEGAISITIYCMVFLLVSVYGRIDKWMLPTIAVVLSIFSVLCIVQLYGGNPLGLYPEGYNYFGANVDYAGSFLGTIGNVDFVAAFFCLTIPVLGVALVRATDQCKWWLVIPLMLSMFVLVKMNVLAGLVGVFVGGLLILPVILPISSKTRKCLWVGLAVIFVLAFVLLYCIDIGSGLMHELHAILHGEISDSFGSGRIYIWRNVLACIPEHFWLGSGPDTMSVAGIEPFSRYDTEKNMLIVAEVDVAHNEYLNILFHQGVFACAAYVVFLATLLFNWSSLSSKNDIVAVLGSAVLCYCIQAIFGISFTGTAIYFWIMLGLLDRSVNECREEGKC